MKLPFVLQQPEFGALLTEVKTHVAREAQIREILADAIMANLQTSFEGHRKAHPTGDGSFYFGDCPGVGCPSIKYLSPDGTFSTFGGSNSNPHDYYNIREFPLDGLAEWLESQGVPPIIKRPVRLKRGEYQKEYPPKTEGAKARTRWVDGFSVVACDDDTILLDCTDKDEARNFIAADELLELVS